MVALKNPHKRSVTFALTHEDAPKALTPFTQTLHDRRTGEAGARKVTLNLPTTVTLLAGETREDLPDHVVEDAKRAGLVVVEQALQEPALPPPEGDNEKPNALKERKKGSQ